MAEIQQLKSSDQFIECLRELEEHGKDLQNALFKRNPQAIWQAIEKQEQCLKKLSASYSTYATETEPNGDGPSDGDDSTKSLVKQLAGKVRRVQRTNRALAHSFLEIIDKTLSELSTKKERNPMVYDASGRINKFAAPVFIEQKG